MEERIHILWLCKGQFFHFVAKVSMASISINYTLMDDYDHSLLNDVTTILIHKNPQSLV